MKPIVRIILLLGTLLLLGITLFYPFGPDQMGFTLGGELIRHGSVQWRDFMDTKPPLIFYIYALGGVLFGHHEWSVRLLDILFHIGSLAYLYVVFRRTLKSEVIAFSSVILYGALYALNNLTTLAQTESFALLPVIVLYDMTERSATNDHPARNGFIAGVATTMLLVMKLTLAAAPIASGIYLMLFAPAASKKTVLRFAASAINGIIVSLAIIGGYFYAVGATERIGQWLTWVREYSKISDQTVQEGLYRIFPMGIVVAFGFSTLVIGSIGGYVLSKWRERPTTYTHLILQFAIGCITVLIERKFFPYHYLRLYWCAMPFIAVGIGELYQVWKRTMSQYSAGQPMRWARQLLFIAGLGAIIFYSNVPRILTDPIKWMSLKISSKDYAQSVEDQLWRSHYKEQIVVADSLRPRLNANDNVFIWGHDAAIYYWLDRYQKKFGLPNAAYVTPWAPQEWRMELLDSLVHTPPKFFIAESDDIRTYITGDTLDSWAYLHRWPALSSFVDSTYGAPRTIGHFHVFERR
ncbi:MAG TPA: glycosyltransferase family 39 protein [Candidatus Kapabacteria bacterium]|nr:glycosyltransferase family 39 protein [Candidatus Kapabacteria bacterium]